MKNTVACLLVMLALCLSTYTRADDYEWSSLSPTQQQLLKPTQSIWPSLSSEARQKYVKGAQRWLESSPEQRQQAQERYHRWKSMSPDKKNQLRGRLKSMSQHSGGRTHPDINAPRQRLKTNKHAESQDNGDDEVRKHRHRHHRQR